MKKFAHAPVTIVLIISQLCLALALSSTSPSFMWSPHINMELKERVDYATLSSKDLAKSVMVKGGWSSILCEGKKLDVAVVFIGKELHSLDVSRKTTTNAALVDLLKDAFEKSNFSMAYPYVSAKATGGTLENSLIEEFEELCGQKLGVNNIIVSESCSVDKGFSKIADMHSIQSYAASTVKKNDREQPELLVYCNGGVSALNNRDQPKSEGDVLSELTSSLDESGAKYAVLYVSNPFNSIQYPLGRFLAEASSVNGSLNSTFCDGACQIKKSLLEGVLVAITLLIILISGLCCMMGIDTPSRFEPPQES